MPEVDRATTPAERAGRIFTAFDAKNIAGLAVLATDDQHGLGMSG